MDGRRHGSGGGDAETLRIGMLGGFRVSVGDRTLPGNAWRLKKAAALVKLLSLAPRHRLHREQAMELLWPDSGTKAASNQLRKALHAARRALDPVEGHRYLASEHDSLVLCPGGSLWVDVETFEEAAITARRERAPAAFRAAIELYAGDLLPEDRYEEWAQERRQELRRMFLSLLIELSNVHQGREEHGKAVEALRRAVAEEPTLEEAHAGLMRLYSHLGQEAEALSQYERLREALLKQLGTEPSTATRRLRDQIASGGFDSVLSSPTRPPHEEESLESSLHNLPAPRTSFVGREQEMLEVKREMAMTRLLTLTGTGGSGKTRLALEVARSLVGAYPDGVWLAELAPLSEGALVPQVVARALAVKERPAQPLIDTLVEVLRTKRVLLVMDNCEHLVEAVAHLVDILLDACPGVRVLATSRERLGIMGEMNWPIPPLSVPDPRRQPTAEELERYESVRLFVERAKYRNPAFVLSPHEMQAVARICERLDGIPLAIELAAARVGLSVEQIASRLDDSLGLLTTGSRTATARQRTLEGTLDWSYDLLSEPERVLFGRLSVFAGGWTLEASEAVASGEGTDKSEVLDLLLGLVDKSLVVAEATGRGGVRYRMLEPVRQYARAKLEQSGEGEAVLLAHAKYFLSLAQVAEPELRGSDSAAWTERLKAEHDNLRTALSRSLNGVDVELGLRLAGTLWGFWVVSGYHDEGRRWLEEALTKASRHSAARMKALEAAGWLANDQGDIDRAVAAAEEALSLNAGAVNSKAASCLRILGYAASIRGDNARAAQLYAESLTLSREASDRLGVAFSLIQLGTLASERGDYEGAKSFYEEGAVLARMLDDTPLLSSYLITLGYEYLLQGEPVRASRLNGEAAVLLRERGYKGKLPYALDNLGWAALVRGDYQQARSLHNQSLELSRELGDRLLAAESLEGLACSASTRGEEERAARLFGAAEALRETGGYFLAPRERALREPFLGVARSRLWQEALAQGRAMSLKEAVEYALSEGNYAALHAHAEQDSPANESPPVALTRREREVARLVARGLTNRQIAEELFVSERTVDHHVSNILKKLDLSSREQVASRLGDH